MATSLRPLQMALSAAGFSVQEQSCLFNTQLFVLQNFLSIGSANVNNSTVLVDAVVSGAPAGSGGVGGNGLQVQLDQSSFVTESNIWIIEAHIAVTTAAAQGLKLQLTTYDGLTILAASDFNNWLNYTFNVNTTAGAAITGVVSTTPNSPAGFQSASGNALSVDLFGMVRVNGSGRIGLQFAQQVAVGANTSITNGYLAAYSLLP